MPWSDITPMSQRLEFVRLIQQRRQSIGAICLAFGISEKTGYKWLARAAAEGPAGLADRSHAPHTPAHQLQPSVATAILGARRAHPTWGPRKLRRFLQEQRPDLAWPAASTIGGLLHRRGLVRPHRRPGGGPARWAPLDARLTPATASNDVWTIDFKGEFRLGSGAYCYPLTVMDLHSRYLLGCTGLASTATATARVVFTRLFQTYGLPRVLRSDNGVPFASPLALGRLSTLAVWWIRLGLRPERITPGAPQENGAHERMHKTLKAETTRPPAPGFTQQQRRFTQFTHEYNTLRPHEGLALDTPATHYTASPVRFPRRLPTPAYAACCDVRRVSAVGMIKWRGTALFLTTSLAGEDVSLEETADATWQIAFGPLVLGTYDLACQHFTPGVYWHASDSPDPRATSPIIPV